MRAGTHRAAAVGRVPRRARHERAVRGRGNDAGLDQAARRGDGGIHEKRLSKEGEKDKKEQREFLMGVIDRIMITIINKKKHQLDIHYKLPRMTRGV